MKGNQQIYDFIDGLIEKVISDGDFMEVWEVTQKREILPDAIEDLVFETIYPKVFRPDEDEVAISRKTFEKFQVLQDIVTPELLGISVENYIPSVYLVAQTELKKINEMKSPRNKLRSIGKAVAHLISRNPRINGLSRFHEWSRRV